MRLPRPAALLSALLLASPAAHASRILQSQSLNQCDGSTSTGFTATLFNVVFTADNGSVDITTGFERSPPC